MTLSVTLSKFPYPFRSMLAFVTDIDTSTFKSLAYVHKCFYGLTEEYEGVSLELSNSFWLMNTQSMSDTYKTNLVFALKKNGKERPFVRNRIAKYFSGHLFDTLHTYGQFKNGMFKRDFAEICLEYAHKNNIHPKVWTYHGSKNQVQNIRPNDKHWVGDDPIDAAYHLDLLAANGVRYFRIPPSLDLLKDDVILKKVKARDNRFIYVFSGQGILNNYGDFKSIETWIDSLISSGELPYERRRIFQPSPNYPNKIQTWKVEMLPFQLSDSVLKNAVEKNRVMLVNQHLTQHFSVYAYRLAPVISAIRRLSKYQSDGKILVTTPSRLLDYLVIRDNISYKIVEHDENLDIVVNPKVDIGTHEINLNSENMQGLSFSLSNSSFKNVRIFVGEKKVELQKSDNCVYIPWESNLEKQIEAIRAFELEFCSELL